MAVRAAIQYIAHYIIRELGLGCYVPTSVSAGATSMRVMDSSLFDPGGGQIFVEDNDNLITYTGIDGDQLTGIPASGTGSISAAINAYTVSTRDLVYRAELMSSYELEILIDRYSRWIEGEKIWRDVERKKHLSIRGWYDTGAELRDDNDDSYNIVTANTISYENGRFEFTTARSLAEQLYLYGWGYNPFASIGDFIETFANDSRWYSYSQVGQTAHSVKNAREIADLWRSRGKWL